MSYEAQIGIFVFLVTCSLAGWKWGISERLVSDFLEESTK